MLWGDKQRAQRRSKVGVLLAVGVLAACLSASIFKQPSLQLAAASGIITAAEASTNASLATGAQNYSQKQQALIDAVMTSLVDARKKVREACLKLKKDGKSIKEIKEAGFTRNNMGCKGHEKESEAMEKCLVALKDSFTPEELFELLELKSDHDLAMLQKQGLKPKTKGWKKGAQVIMCWTGKDKDKEGCTLRRVRSITGGKAMLRHIKIDTTTGMAKRDHWEFTAYSLKAWKE